MPRFRFSLLVFASALLAAVSFAADVSLDPAIIKLPDTKEVVVVGKDLKPEQIALAPSLEDDAQAPQVKLQFTYLKEKDEKPPGAPVRWHFALKGDNSPAGASTSRKANLILGSEKFPLTYTLAAAGTAPATAAQPTASLEPKTLSLPKGASDGAAKVTVKVTGLTDDQRKMDGKEATLTDTTTGSPPNIVTFSAPEKVETTADKVRLWTFSVDVKGLKDSSQKRQAQFQLDKSKSDSYTAKLEYTLNNAGTAPVWTITPPVTPWTITGWVPGRRCTTFTITTGENRAEEVDLIQSNLIEASTNKTLGLDHLSLCKSAGQPCGSLGLEANRANKVFLCVDGNFHSHGVFQGPLYLSAANKPETQAMAVTINSSSFWAKLLGLILIAIGVRLAWFVMTFSKNRLARDQALASAFVRREQWSALLQKFKAINSPLVKQNTLRTVSAILDGIQKLTDNYLDGQSFLPPPNPDPFSQVTVDGPGYKAFLQRTDLALEKLTAIVNEGLCQVPALIEQVRNHNNPPALTQAEETTIAGAVQTIDALSTNLGADLATIRGAFTPAFAQIRALLLPPGAPHPAGSAAGAAAGAAHVSPKTLDAVKLEMGNINQRVWLIATALTTLAGYYVVILPNAGFGTPTDLLKCILWGFGLPLAGQALTPSSVKTSLLSS